MCYNRQSLFRMLCHGRHENHELPKRVKSPGWRLVTGKKEDRAVTGTLETW
jgi:hypothetical protein